MLNYRGSDARWLTVLSREDHADQHYLTQERPFNGFTKSLRW